MKISKSLLKEMIRKCVMEHMNEDISLDGKQQLKFDIRVILEFNNEGSIGPIEVDKKKAEERLVRAITYQTIHLEDKLGEDSVEARIDIDNITLVNPLSEEGQPEPYDAETGQFGYAPRDRTNPSKSSQLPKQSNTEDPVYVEYHSQRQGEVPFKMGDENTYEYVNATYPDGTVDIGVYSQRGDIVYSYETFRKMYNIQ